MLPRPRGWDNSYVVHQGTQPQLSQLPSWHQTFSTASRAIRGLPTDYVEYTFGPPKPAATA